MSQKCSLTVFTRWPVMSRFQQSQILVSTPSVTIFFDARVGRLRAFAVYHFPECAPPSTCSTSPVT
jgi:hypothetical protein